MVAGVKTKPVPPVVSPPFGTDAPVKGSSRLGSFGVPIAGNAGLQGAPRRSQGSGACGDSSSTKSGGLFDGSSVGSSSSCGSRGGGGRAAHVVGPRGTPWPATGSSTSTRSSWTGGLSSPNRREEASVRSIVSPPRRSPSAQALNVKVVAPWAADRRSPTERVHKPQAESVMQVCNSRGALVAPRVADITRNSHPRKGLSATSSVRGPTQTVTNPDPSPPTRNRVVGQDVTFGPNTDVDAIPKRAAAPCLLKEQLTTGLVPALDADPNAPSNGDAAGSVDARAAEAAGWRRINGYQVSDIDRVPKRGRMNLMSADARSGLPWERSLSPGDDALQRPDSCDFDRTFPGHAGPSSLTSSKRVLGLEDMISTSNVRRLLMSDDDALTRSLPSLPSFVRADDVLAEGAAGAGAPQHCQDLSSLEVKSKANASAAALPTPALVARSQSSVALQHGRASAAVTTSSETGAWLETSVVSPAAVRDDGPTPSSSSRSQQPKAVQRPSRTQERKSPRAHSQPPPPLPETSLLDAVSTEASAMSPEPTRSLQPPPSAPSESPKLAPALPKSRGGSKELPPRSPDQSARTSKERRRRTTDGGALHSAGELFAEPFQFNRPLPPHSLRTAQRGPNGVGEDRSKKHEFMMRWKQNNVTDVDHIQKKGAGVFAPKDTYLEDKQDEYRQLRSLSPSMHSARRRTSPKPQALPATVSPREELFGSEGAAPKSAAPTNPTSSLARSPPRTQPSSGGRSSPAERLRHREEEPQYSASPLERGQHIEALSDKIRQMRHAVDSAIGSSAPAGLKGDVENKNDVWNRWSSSQATDVDRMFRKGRGECSPLPPRSEPESSAQTRGPSPRAYPPLTTSGLASMLKTSSVQDLGSRNRILDDGLVEGSGRARSIDASSAAQAGAACSSQAAVGAIAVSSGADSTVPHSLEGRSAPKPASSPRGRLETRRERARWPSQPAVGSRSPSSRAVDDRRPAEGGAIFANPIADVSAAAGAAIQQEACARPGIRQLSPSASAPQLPPPVATVITPGPQSADVEDASTVAPGANSLRRPSFAEDGTGTIRDSGGSVTMPSVARLVPSAMSSPQTGVALPFAREGLHTTRRSVTSPPLWTQSRQIPVVVATQSQPAVTNAAALAPQPSHKPGDSAFVPHRNQESGLASRPELLFLQPSTAYRSANTGDSMNSDALCNTVPATSSRAPAGVFVQRIASDGGAMGGADSLERGVSCASDQLRVGSKELGRPSPFAAPINTAVFPDAAATASSSVRGHDQQFMPAPRVNVANPPPPVRTSLPLSGRRDSREIQPYLMPARIPGLRSEPAATSSARMSPHLGQQISSFSHDFAFVAPGAKPPPSAAVVFPRQAAASTPTLAMEQTSSLPSKAALLAAATSSFAQATAAAVVHTPPPTLALTEQPAAATAAPVSAAELGSR